ncbi:MAG TPA: DUF1295 domain-containing protein [Candidatus Saccharimonadales bacterium]|nr:DUF1295 domain-containing protein [Candidatus Saccharimonadales bacterium]
MLLVLCLGIALAINLLLFFVAYHRKSDKLTDFAYALSFISITITAFSLSSIHSMVFTIASGMVLLWALRLGTFLVYRILGTGVDRRFDGMRKDFVKFMRFWLGQGMVAWFLLLPLLSAANRTSHPGPLSYIGIAIWLIGFTVEATADGQKYRFKQNPHNKDRWIAEGIWRYSRHPNYFGEITIWIGIYVTVFGSLSALERVVGLASPLAITISLLFISGVPILEKSADAKWGKDKGYQAYKRRTSLVVPWWRKA